MSRKNGNKQTRTRRVYTDEFKQEAVQMLLDGHSAGSVCERLGLSGTNLLYGWKRKILQGEGGIASTDANSRRFTMVLQCPSICSGRLKGQYSSKARR